MAYTEMLGGREARIVHASGPGPHYVDYIVRFIGDVDDAPIARGAAYANKDAADPVSEAIWTSEPKRTTTNKSIMTVRYRGYFLEA